jgi:hypothetical protein
VSRCCVFEVVLEAANVWRWGVEWERGSCGGEVVAGYFILFVVVCYNVEDGVVCSHVRVIDM